MKKYTFISEYRKGTYVSQYEGVDLYACLKVWVNNLDLSIYLSNDVTLIKEEIEIEDYNPTPIKTIDNVWCCTFLSGKSFLLLNIIETV